jgi:hypothetical protein
MATTKVSLAVVRDAVRDFSGHARRLGEAERELAELRRARRAGGRPS